MTTRTIITSQPDVACDVCERRLLRGEHPDIFLAACNASEYPRRIAGIARSLGVAAVKVRPAENAVGDVVAILVAWELCWYRYEVDLDVDPDRVRLTAQG